MEIRRRRGARTAFSAGLVLLGVGTSLGCRKESAEGSVASESVAAPLRLSLPTARAERYSLVIETMTEMGVGPVPLFVRLESELEVRAEERGGSVFLGVQLVEPKLLDPAKRAIDPGGGLLKDLRVPFGFEVRDGRLTAYFDPPDVGRNSAGYRAVVASLFQLEPHAPNAKWSAREWDGTGLAEVEFALLEPGKLARRLVRYEKLAFRTGRAPEGAQVDLSKLLPAVEDSSGEILLDARGLRRVVRNESLSIPTGVGKSLRNRTKVELERTEAPSALRLEAAWFADARRRDVTEAPRGRLRGDWDEVVDDGRTFAELSKVLATSGKPGEEGSAAERAPAFRALVALFRRDPKAVETALASLLRGEGAEKGAVIDALGMVSSKSSFAALASILGNPKVPKNLRQRAALAGIRAPYPDEPGLEFVEKLLGEKDYRKFGVLGLGTFVRHFREDRLEGLAGRGRTRLRELLVAAKSRDDRVDALLAIANSGAPELFPDVQPFLVDPNSSVRDAAIQSMRLMPLAEVEVKLDALLRQPSLPEVLSSLQALALRKEPLKATVEEVTRLATTHENADLRRAAALALVAWRSTHPEVEATLRALRQNDSSKLVRDAIPSL